MNWNDARRHVAQRFEYTPESRERWRRPPLDEEPLLDDCDGWVTGIINAKADGSFWGFWGIILRGKAKIWHVKNKRTGAGHAVLQVGDRCTESNLKAWVDRDILEKKYHFDKVRSPLAVAKKMGLWWL